MQNTNLNRQVLAVIVRELGLDGDPAMDQPIFTLGADSLDSIKIQIELEDLFKVAWSPRLDITADATPQVIVDRLAIQLPAKDSQ